MEHIWTMLMHKILQNHLLCAFVANLKIDAIYALYPESFCDKNLAFREVFAFCDSAHLIENKQRNLWVTSLLAVVLADQESRIPPLHVEVRVDRDAEVLVRHLGHKK